MAEEAPKSRLDESVTPRYSYIYGSSNSDPHTGSYLLDF